MARREAKSAAAPQSESALREIILRCLAGAPRTRQELTRDLLRRGANPEVFDPLLDRFTEVRLIDDGQFARMWAQSRQRGRGLSRAALRRELRERGVEPDLVESAVAAVSPDDEWQRARELALRRMSRSRGTDAVAERRRLLGFLMRRGYSVGVATSVIAEVSRARTVL
jgi:regulatory protein